MSTLKLATVLCLSLLVAPSFAQTTGDSRPGDGAITGGKPIVPGESAGLPNKDVSAGTSDERLQRCYELSGSDTPQKQDKIQVPPVTK